MVISDFFHFRLGASVGGDQQNSYSLRCLFPTGPSVCLGGGGSTGFQFKKANTSCGISTGPASLYINTLTFYHVGLHV